MGGRWIVACAAGLVLAGSAPSAQAFNCYIGGDQTGTVTIHKRPDERSPVVARLDWSAMVSDGRRPRERDGWIRVRWSRGQLPQSQFDRGGGDGSGWIRRELIRGECED